MLGKMCMTFYWDSRSRRLEFFFSQSANGNPIDLEKVKEYADSYCPPEFRMIEGVDSLRIQDSFPVKEIGKS